MEILVDTIMILVWLPFPAILALVAGVAIPRLFLVVLAPLLDRILPVMGGER
jgi:hypothetical protein